MTEEGTLERERDRYLKERDQYARALAELTDQFDLKVEELSTVRQLGDLLGSSLDIKTICERTVDLLQETFAPENCSVFLSTRDGHLALAAARGAFDDEAKTFDLAAQETVFRRGQGVAGQALETGTVIRIGDVALDPRFESRPGAAVRPTSLLCAPLSSRGRGGGVINLSDSEPDAFATRHEHILAIVANTVAMAIENALLFEEVSRSREMLAYENRDLRMQLSSQTDIPLVGNSRAFRAAVQLVEKVADTTASVLLTGESGTGKEVMARVLHKRSRRNESPFVAINCAALPETLLEAELFGIEKGVATGVSARPGTFERADGGTLFLDEVGDMSPAVQVRLLRVLQERKVTRVGGRSEQNFDVRVVSATHRVLADEIAAGRFREDLYYRLKVISIDLPPLRDRREDLLPLAEYFLSRFIVRHGRPDLQLGRAAARAILDHSWPGNVRELENAIEQAVLIADGREIAARDLGLAVVHSAGIRLEIPEDGLAFRQTMTEIQTLAERKLSERALRDVEGNRTRAARALGLARRTLLYKMERLGIH